MFPTMLKSLSKGVRLAIFVLSLILVLVGIWIMYRELSTDKPSPENVVLPEGSLSPLKIGLSLPESAPVRLRIPTLNIDTGFVALGLTANNEIEIPKGYEEVGWYINGPAPGEIGPAVVLGHVDSYEGPAVFFYLGQLKPGDLIEIERQDGKVAVFRVDYLKRYLQSEFPTELVYGNLDYAGLRLITCSGVYDRETDEYNLNLIVYASLVEVR